MRSVIATGGPGQAKVNLEKVVDRLRTLTRENEELERRIEGIVGRKEEGQAGVVNELTKGMEGEFCRDASFFVSLTDKC